MSINSITSPAVQGIQRGFQGLRQVALEIADSNAVKRAEPTDIARAMVEMKQHANQTKASAKVLRQLDQTLGTLFDERV